MPFTFFCHQGSPGLVREFLAENGAAVEGTADGWTASVWTAGGFLKPSDEVWILFANLRENALGARSAPR
jgi:hypothetical protein